MRLLILLALVALPANASQNMSNDIQTCYAAMDDEFWPEWSSSHENGIGCINPAICGGIWSSILFEVKRRPAGKKMTVWCRVEGDEVTLSETNPYKRDEEEQFAAP